MLTVADVTGKSFLGQSFKALIGAPSFMCQDDYTAMAALVQGLLNVAKHSKFSLLHIIGRTASMGLDIGWMELSVLCFALRFELSWVIACASGWQ